MNNRTEYGGYRLLYDYHTHTVFSHGKGSIEDNVRSAIEAGLRGVGISDHGPGHLTYGIKRENIPVMKKEIERLRIKYPEIEIYASVEANTISVGNHLDLSQEEMDTLDYVIAGYHYGITHGYCIENYLSDHLRKERPSLKLMVKNTDMVTAALYENRIKILTHPGDKGPFDMDELAKACEKTGTLMEINTRHYHLTGDEIKKAAKYDVSFVISSDAHTPDRVGDAASGIKLAFDSGVEPERIVNIAKI